jgi:hypothetical protein
MKKIIFIGLIFNLILTSSFAEDVTPKIKLIYGRWGKDIGEFGIKEKGDHPIDRIGPNDFFIDEDNKIYIMDNVNERVQLFDSQGKFLKIDEQLYRQSVAKGEERTIIFEDGSKITYSTTKEPEVQYPNAKKYKIEPIYEPSIKYPKNLIWYFLIIIKLQLN